jgi:hypothetical protein
MERGMTILFLAATDESSPWPPVIAGIAGTVIGGLVAFLGTWWQEQRRWQREDRLRWDPARFNAYGQFIEAARLTMNRAEAYGGSVAWAKRLEEQELAAQKQADEEYTATESEQLQYVHPRERPKWQTELRQQIDSRHLASIRASGQDATEQHERLRLELSNAADSLTRAVAEIELIGSALTVQAATTLHGHIEEVVRYATAALMRALEEFDNQEFRSFHERFEQLLTEFEERAKAELTSQSLSDRSLI